jgi:aspartyl/asparaginyl beta-hydroxylase (cupin superfamily)
MAYDASLEAWLDELRSRFGARGLSRIQDMLRIRASERDAAPAPLQQTHTLHIPRLDSRPWYAAETFPWHDRVQELIPHVRAELDVLLDRGAGQPYVAGPDLDRHARSDAGESGAARAFLTWPATVDDWTVFPLYRHGRWLEPNARLWPAARHLIECTPYSPGEGLCSVLEPHGRIQLHSSGCNAVLTCHLPLIVPDGCGIQVGLESRSWTESRIVVFDDSFMHRAWNDSPSRRVCLIWEIWHPGLTDIEVASLEVFYPRLMGFGSG